ncbi:MAG: HPr(Ser) kinase/phosphatase [Chlamydiales bacterium]|nr:HPr(Ser) kinase/phosphatase [Chlamydiales bacterium]
MYLVQDFVNQYGKSLGLELIAGRAGLSRRIKKPEVERPGLSLTGFLSGHVPNRMLVIGRQETYYLQTLDLPLQLERLKALFTSTTPAVIVARACRIPKEWAEFCDHIKLPLFRATSNATNLLSRLTFCLLEQFCSSVTLHGTLVEVFGVGLLIQGESSVGKSEAALGLIERGHRLISDDLVRVKKKEGSYLVGTGPELSRHLMEIRGIGIINVAHLYGAVCVRPDKGLDIVVKLEEWDDQHFYDRVGLDEKFIDVLGVSLPYHLLPVKPGRDVVLLLETIALNHRLKDMGYNSAKEFNTKLLETLARRPKKRVVREKTYT